jgi:hypothetical protein
MRPCELRHKEGNIEFASYRRPPVIDRKIGHRAEVWSGRVVVDDVDPAVGGHGILNHLPRLFGVGEIDRRDASHLTAGATYEFDCLVVGINVDVAPDNLCTFSRKGLRRDATQTSSGAGDQHDLLVKYSHSFLLRATSALPVPVSPVRHSRLPRSRAVAHDTGSNRASS